MSDAGAETAEAPNASRRAWAGLLVLALPTLLLSIDVSVLYLALPTLSRELGASATEQLWILDIYSFLLAGFLVTMGGLADRIGRRRLMLIGAATFGLASLGAALAPNAAALICCRAILGIAGATLMPTTLATVRHLFAGTRQMSSAMGVWFGCFMIGMIMGPLAGGLILARFSWGAVFLLGIPVMLLLLAVGPVILPESKAAKPGRIDPTSVLLSLAALLPIAWGIKEVARSGVTVPPALAVAVGLIAGWRFVARQRQIDHPLVDLALFRIRAFSGALSISAVGGIVMAGTSLLMAIYLQSVAGLSALQAGLWLIPQNLAMIAGFAAAPAIAKKVRERYVIAAGLLTAALGFSLLTLVDAQRYGLLLVGMGLASFGVAAPMALGTSVLMSAAPEEQAGSAASIMETSGELGVALGVATLGSLAAGVYRASLENTAVLATPPDAALGQQDRSSALGGIEDALAVASGLPHGLGDALAAAARGAFVSGIHVVGGVSAAIFIALALVAVLALDIAAPPADAAKASPGEAG